jgi:hypothetical protein
MKARIELLTPQGVMACPDVPDHFGDLRQGECMILGAWPEDMDIPAEELPGEDMLGCIAVVPLSLDPETVAIRFLWLQEDTDQETVYKDLFWRLRGLIRHEGMKRILLWTFSVEGEIVAGPDPELLKNLGWIEEQHTLKLGGWSLRDIYDSDFLAKDTPRLEQDPQLERFDSFSRRRLLQLMRRLQIPENEAVLSPSIESPFSRLYMEGRNPRGMVCAEKPCKEIVVLSHSWFPLYPSRESIFQATMAGALGAALEGEGLDTLLLARFSRVEHLRTLENLIGPADVETEQRAFIFPMN